MKSEVTPGRPKQGSRPSVRLSVHSTSSPSSFAKQAAAAESSLSPPSLTNITTIVSLIV